ncbi:MAG TPA: DUF4435 domain-containing protein [Candidatus Nanopelagicales bacterium]|nr:DUF4435 domain-containing protein [Candidatus Nanopelagicales bacterium]
MSGRYLQGQALYHACASGRGVIVMLEGETPQEDPYFYERWFGARALEVSFFPQNGLGKVVSAVRDLRVQLPHRQVFGIVDRDFADAALLSSQASALPGDGIFRTSCFTIENYLLEASGWLRVVQLLRRGVCPPGWSSEAELRSQIEAAYRRCIPLAAFNYTVRMEYDRLPRDGIGYKEHPDAVQEPEARLDDWAATTGRSPPQPLSQMYSAHLQRLQALDPAEWPVWISGKAVLKVFLKSFPCPSGNVSQDILVNLYLEKQPQPPSEIEALVNRIVDRAGHP